MTEPPGFFFIIASRDGQVADGLDSALGLTILVSNCYYSGTCHNMGQLGKRAAPAVIMHMQQNSYPQSHSLQHQP